MKLATRWRAFLLRKNNEKNAVNNDFLCIFAKIKTDNHS